MGRSFIGTFGLVLLSIAALWVADVFLANVEKTETHAQAVRLFDEGQTLRQRGENAQAIERIEDALAIERTNRWYLQSLADAQVAAGRNSDAQATLAQLLDTDSTDGFACLLMGRIAAKEGEFGTAVSYFHRAIYGHWNDHESDNRQRARFELIDYLAEHNSKEELLAELLPVEEHAPKDLKSRLRLGQLLLLAGSPGRAADVFRGIVRDEPANAEAHAGLGEADFARADYRGAQRHFEEALRLAPNDGNTRRHLEVCSEFLALDPMRRGLDPQERYRRSLKLLELTSAEVDKCITKNQPPEVEALLDKAASAQTAHVKAARQGESAEANLDLAEQLWQLRKRECKAAAPSDTPLALVLARLGQ